MCIGLCGPLSSHYVLTQVAWFVLPYSNLSSLYTLWQQHQKLSSLFTLWFNAWIGVSSNSNYLHLQMFWLQHLQMFVCKPNPKTTFGYFCIYLSVIDYKYLYVISFCFQKLNLLRKRHFLSKLQIFVCYIFWPNFFIKHLFLSFFIENYFQLPFLQEFFCRNSTMSFQISWYRNNREMP